MQASKQIKGCISNKLKGKTIILGMSGGIACVDCVKLARQLIRHDAHVVTVMTDEACRFITPLSMQFATGENPFVNLSGKAEHVSIDADMLLIAPCTANTLAKISLGIGDNALTTFALNSDIPVVIAPSMHRSMYENSVVQDHISKCSARGISIVPPIIEESKAKMADYNDIVNATLRFFRNEGHHKRILIIGGSTHEPIDDVRELTNLSSGKMASALANEAYERGYEIEFWGSYKGHSYIPTRNFKNIADIIKLIETSQSFDIIINCAAISDFTVKKTDGKIPSGKKITLSLQPAKRINPYLKLIGSKIIGFKLVKNEMSVVKNAILLLKKDELDLVIGNTILGLGGDSTTVWIIGKNGLIKKISGNKTEIARNIFDYL